MTDNLELQTDTYLPLRNVVFQTLRSAILRGELKPGERLMELQLAAKLGVSRTPIREAIRMLEQEGLAITIPRKGAEVAHMSIKDMEDVLMIRQALENLAVKKACENVTDEVLVNLHEAMEQFENAVRGGDVGKIAKADVCFHEIIYAASNNPKLVMLLGNLREQMYRYRVEYLKDTSIHTQLIREHKSIYQLLSAKRAKDVQSIIEKHLFNQAEAVREIIREQQ